MLSLSRRLILAAKIALAAGMVAWLLTSGRLQFGRLASVPWDGRLVLLLALVVGSMLLPVFRWWWLLRIQCLREPLASVLMLTWAGYFTALILPGAASGDLAKGYLILRSQPHARTRAFSTALADRLIGLHSLLMLGVLASLCLLWCGETEYSVQAMGAATFVMVTGPTLGIASLLLQRPRRLLLRILPARWAEAWNDSFQNYRDQQAIVCECWGASLLANILTIASLGLAGQILAYRMPWDVTFLIGPFIVLGNCLPLTPGGIGIAETVSNELFALERPTEPRRGC